MQLNRKDIPDELKETKNRKLLSSEIYWDENSPLSISSYVVKTSKGKKNVILLSNAPPILGITKDDGQILSTTEWGFTLVNQKLKNGQ